MRRSGETNESVGCRSASPRHVAHAPMPRLMNAQDCVLPLHIKRLGAVAVVGVTIALATPASRKDLTRLGTRGKVLLERKRQTPHSGGGFPSFSTQSAFLGRSPVDAGMLWRNGSVKASKPRNSLSPTQVLWVAIRIWSKPRHALEAQASESPDRLSSPCRKKRVSNGKRDLVGWCGGGKGISVPS